MFMKVMFACVTQVSWGTSLSWSRGGFWTSWWRSTSGRGRTRRASAASSSPCWIWFPRKELRLPSASATPGSRCSSREGGAGLLRYHQILTSDKDLTVWSFATLRLLMEHERGPIKQVYYLFISRNVPFLCTRCSLMYPAVLDAFIFFPSLLCAKRI